VGAAALASSATATALTVLTNVSEHKNKIPSLHRDRGCPKVHFFMRSCDHAIGRLGDWAIGRLGDWAIGRLGDWAIGRLGDWAIGRL
jgi:hypothetical protein